MMMKHLICFTVLATVLIFSGCNPTVTTVSQSEPAISQIYFYDMNIGFTQDEYKIDLISGKFYQFHTYPENIEIRDAKAANEGYQKVDDLSKDKVASFQKKVQKYDIADWKESYINGYDGYWGFQFTFSDGSEKNTKGNLDYPKTWDDLAAALKDLTGVEILWPASDN